MATMRVLPSHIYMLGKELPNQYAAIITELFCNALGYAPPGAVARSTLRLLNDDDHERAVLYMLSHSLVTAAEMKAVLDIGHIADVVRMMHRKFNCGLLIVAAKVCRHNKFGFWCFSYNPVDGTGVAGRVYCIDGNTPVMHTEEPIHFRWVEGALTFLSADDDDVQDAIAAKLWLGSQWEERRNLAGSDKNLAKFIEGTLIAKAMEKREPTTMIMFDQLDTVVGEDGITRCAFENFSSPCDDLGKRGAPVADRFRTKLREAFPPPMRGMPMLGGTLSLIKRRVLMISDKPVTTNEAEISSVKQMNAELASRTRRRDTAVVAADSESPGYDREDIPAPEMQNSLAAAMANFFGMNHSPAIVEAMDKEQVVWSQAVALITNANDDEWKLVTLTRDGFPAADPQSKVRMWIKATTWDAKPLSVQAMKAHYRKNTTLDGIPTGVLLMHGNKALNAAPFFHLEGDVFRGSGVALLNAEWKTLQALFWDEGKVTVEMLARLMMCIGSRAAKRELEEFEPDPAVRSEQRKHNVAAIGVKDYGFKELTMEYTKAAMPKGFLIDKTKKTIETKSNLAVTSKDSRGRELKTRAHLLELQGHKQVMVVQLGETEQSLDKYKMLDTEPCASMLMHIFRAHVSEAVSNPSEEAKEMRAANKRAHTALPRTIAANHKEAGDYRAELDAERVSAETAKERKAREKAEKDAKDAKEETAAQKREREKADADKKEEQRKRREEKAEREKKEAEEEEERKRLEEEKKKEERRARAAERERDHAKEKADTVVANRDAERRANKARGEQTSKTHQSNAKKLDSEAPTVYPAKWDAWGLDAKERPTGVTTNPFLQEDGAKGTVKFQGLIPTIQAGASLFEPTSLSSRAQSPKIKADIPRDVLAKFCEELYSQDQLMLALSMTYNTRRKRPRQQALQHAALPQGPGERLARTPAAAASGSKDRVSHAAPRSLIESLNGSSDDDDEEFVQMTEKARKAATAVAVAASDATMVDAEEE